MAAVGPEPIPLAPEAEAGISAALARLDREAARLATKGDPTADVIAAYANSVRAISRMVIDAKLKTDAHTDAVAKMIQAAVIPKPMPLTRAELRGSVATALKDYLPTFGRKIHIGAIAAIVAMLVGAVGLGYWWRSTRADAVMVTNCAPAPQPSGGEAFACTFWTHPPTLGQR